MEARLDSMLLPEPAAMGKFLSYETSINRQLRQDISRPQSNLVHVTLKKKKASSGLSL
jgi:hypothetical protein